MALRDQNFFNIHLLPADTSWYFAYRVFILIVMLMPVSILLLLKNMYAGATKRWPLYAYLGMAAVAAVLICVLPTQEIVTVSTAAYYASVPYLLYLIFASSAITSGSAGCIPWISWCSPAFSSCWRACCMKRS